jgi:hypothetical protein
LGNTELLPTIWPHVIKQRFKPSSGLSIAIYYQFDCALSTFKVELLHLTVQFFNYCVDERVVILYRALE